jgi:uncharacterized protein (TIGR02466 family)
MIPAFAAPLISAQLPDCEALNQELRELFVARAAEGDKYRNTTPFVNRNDALFESNFRLFDWPHECIRKLRDFCVAALYRTIGELNGYDQAFLAKLQVAHEAWYHLTRRGGFFAAHNHPLHSWSGVYCVSHHGDDPETDSGKLTFINPFATHTMYIDMATAKLKPPYGAGHRKIRLQEGQLIIFPSWMLHEVLPYDGDDIRITVAFNARFRLAGAQPADEPLG